MTIRERLELFWAGERPDKIPFTIYQNEWRHTQNEPEWQPMFEAGLGVTWHVCPYHAQSKDVEYLHDEYSENGKLYHRQTIKTPIGALNQTWLNGWQRKHLLETAEDYRTMIWIVSHTDYSPCYNDYLEMERRIAPYGVALSSIGRTPLQTILVDYVGLENFSLHLLDFADEMQELYEALLVNFKKGVLIAAEGPGRFVSNLENFTAESLGPKRYEKYLLPVYKECFPILQQAGKIVGTHYDGRTASCKNLISQAPIDLIESLTEPNEGDLPLEEAREAWSDKLFWCNIRVGDYQLPPSQLHDKVLNMVQRGSVNGRLFAFEVSEQYPVNWRTSIPIVLEAMEETRQ